MGGIRLRHCPMLSIVAARLLVIVVAGLISVTPTTALEPSKPLKHTTTPQSQESALKSTIAAANTDFRSPPLNTNGQHDASSIPSSKRPHPPPLPNTLSKFDSLMEQQKKQGDVNFDKYDALMLATNGRQQETERLQAEETESTIPRTPTSISPRLLHKDRIDKYDQTFVIKLVYTNFISLRPNLIRRITLSHLIRNCAAAISNNLEEQQQKKYDHDGYGNDDDIYISTSDSLYERLIYNAMHGLSDDEVKNIDDVTLQYKDIDGDLTTISSTEELLDAIDQLYMNPNHKNSLRLNVGIINHRQETIGTDVTEEYIDKETTTTLPQTHTATDSNSNGETISSISGKVSDEVAIESNTVEDKNDEVDTIANDITSKVVADAQQRFTNDDHGDAKKEAIGVATANGSQTKNSLNQDETKLELVDDIDTTEEIGSEIVATYSNGVVIYANGTVGVVEPTANGNHLDSLELSKSTNWNKWKLPFGVSSSKAKLADVVAQRVPFNSILDGVATTLTAAEIVLDAVVPKQNPINTYKKRRAESFMERTKKRKRLQQQQVQEQQQQEQQDQEKQEQQQVVDNIQEQKQLERVTRPRQVLKRSKPQNQADGEQKLQQLPSNSQSQQDRQQYQPIETPILKSQPPPLEHAGKEKSVAVNATLARQVSPSISEMKKSESLQSWATKPLPVSRTTQKLQRANRITENVPTSTSSPRSMQTPLQHPKEKRIGPKPGKTHARAMSRKQQVQQRQHEQEKQQRPFIHARHSCDCCNVKPILGKRYHAIDEDYDLCEMCFKKPQKYYLGPKVLEFVEQQDDIDVPCQEQWHIIHKQLTEKDAT